MNDNPYSAPQPFALPPERVAGQPLAKRPIAILLFLVLGSMFASWQTYHLLRSAGLMLFYIGTSVDSWWLLGVALRSLPICVEVVLLWGVFKRWRWARWVSVVLMSLLSLPLLWSFVVQWGRAAVQGSAYLAGATIAIVIMSGLWLSWLYYIGFSAKARRYYAKPDQD